MGWYGGCRDASRKGKACSMSHPERNDRIRHNAMNRHWTFLMLASFALCLYSASGSCVGEAQPLAVPPSARHELVVLGGVTGSKSLENGIEIKSSGAVMRITALRDDVLRVRVGAHGQLPGDASWTVVS